MLRAARTGSLFGRGKGRARGGGGGGKGSVSRGVHSRDNRESTASPVHYRDNRESAASPSFLPEQGSPDVIEDFSDL